MFLRLFVRIFYAYNRNKKGVFRKKQYESTKLQESLTFEDKINLVEKGNFKIKK